MSVAARSSGGLRPAPFGLLGDERLARLAAAGHARAFAVVYERHHQALYRYCRSILRDELDAQDALQSTFAAAFAALGRGRRDAPIRPWLFRIAHNESVSALRRRRPTTDLSAASDWCTTTVEDQAAERAEFDMLVRDLRELGERQRSALIMRELSGLSHEEIAIALDTSVGAAKQTIYEARRSLFEFAEGRSVPCDEIRRTISDADGRLLRSRRVRAHLRECSGCAAFAAAIPERGRELRAVVPMLPAVVAAGMLGRVTGGGAAHGAGTGLAGLAVGAAGKAAGTTMAANALAGIAVVASATVGVTIGVDKLAHAGSHSGASHAATPAVHPVARPARTSLPTRVLPAARPLILRESHSASRPVPPTAGPRRAAAGVAGRRTATAAPPPNAAPASATTPGRSAVDAGQTTVAAHGKAASAPGHTTSSSTAHGRSASAPGHTTSSSTAHRRSASAPGHSTSSSTATSRSPGHSGSAPRQTTSSPTASGHSGSAPGHASSAGAGAPSAAGSGQIAVVPVTATLPAVTVTEPLPADPPGAVVSAPHKKH